MSGDIPPDGAYKPRSALGDVTNLVGKRGFALISSSCVKSGGDCKKDKGIQFAKKECKRIDNPKKENNNEEIAECVLQPHSYSISKIACEVKESCPPDVRKNASSSSSCVVKAGDVVSDSSQPTKVVHAIPLDDNGPDVVVEAEEVERTDSEVLPQIESKELAENKSGLDDRNDVSLENLDSSKDEYADCLRFPESQESKCDLDSCIGQKGDGLSSTGTDMIKDCPCSFCMKAACLWSDLHYQDIKGRIAAIKKSQKEAAILVNRYSRDAARNCESISNLESDLTGRWKSLFLHVEDIFIREGTQLERSLSTFKELIDNCKTDSEKN